MLRYARQDTHYLLYVYDRLRYLYFAELFIFYVIIFRVDLEKLEFGGTREVFRLSREYSLSKYEKPVFSETDYKKV